ncbi:MAG: hypothetical protein WA090_03095 [Candidatus Nanopelagicaceae bacterium]
MAIGSGMRLLIVGVIVSCAVGFTVFLVDLSLLGYLFLGSGVLVIAILLGNDFRLLFTSVMGRPFASPDLDESKGRIEPPSPQTKTTSSYRY